MIGDDGPHLEYRLRLSRSDQPCRVDSNLGDFGYPFSLSVTEQVNWWFLKFEGVGYTKSNEEVDRAIKEAVAVMLRALQADENSIPLNHDFVFYPQLSPELISLSTRCSALPTHPFAEQIPQASDEIGRPPSLSTTPNIVNPSVCPPATADPNGANFGSAHEGDLSDTTPSAESPVDRNMQQAFTGVPNIPMEGSTYPSNIPSYMNQVPSLVPFSAHSGLEEVPPILNMGQPENVVYTSNPVPSFPVQIESTHFYPSESANTYDSTESLPVYVNPSFGHPKDPDVFVTLKVPAHAQPLAAQFAHHLCTSRRSDPILIVPSDTNTSGYMSVLYDNFSFLCSRNGVGSGFNVMPIPATSSFLEVQNKPNLTQNGGKVIRAPYNGFVVVNPEGEMHYVQRPMIILPGNTQRPLMELPLLSSDGSSVQLDDIVTLLMHLREGAGSSGTSSSTALSRDQSTVDSNYFSLPLNVARPPPSLQPSHQSQQASFTRQQAQAAANLRPPLPPRLPAGSLLHADLSGITPSSPLDYPPPPTNRPPTVVSSNATRPQPNQPGQNHQLQQMLASALAAQGTKGDQVQQQQPQQQQQQMQPNLDYLISLFSTNPSLFQAILSTMCNSATPPSVPSQPPSSANLAAANTLSQSSASLSLWGSNASSITSSNDIVKQLLMRSAGTTIADGIGGGYVLQVPPHSGGGMTPAVPPTVTAHAPITSGVAPQQVPTSVAPAVQQVYTTLPPAQSQPHQPQATEVVYEQNAAAAVQPLMVPTSPSSVMQPRMSQPTIAVPIASQQQQTQIAANPPPPPPPQAMLQQQQPALIPQPNQQPPQLIQHQIQQPSAAKVMQQQPPPQQIHQVQQPLASQVIQQQQQQSAQQVHQVPQHKPHSQATQIIQPQPPPQQHMPISGSVGNQLVGSGAAEATKMSAPHKISAPMASVQQPLIPPPHPPSQPVAMVSQPSPPQVVMPPTMPVAAGPPQHPQPPTLPPASIALIPPTPAQVVRPPLPITTSPPAAPSKFIVSSVASVPASATNVIGRESANSLNPTACQPASFLPVPQSSPSSQSAVNAVGNKFTVLPVDPILNQPIPLESTHSPSQPVPPSQLPPMASQNPTFPPQGQPPVQTAATVAAPKKIPPKFTVTAVDDVSAPLPLPGASNGSNSLSLKAPQRRETLLKAVLDGDLSTECPPPPTTPSNVNANSVMNTPTPSPPLCIAPPSSPPPPRKSILSNPVVPSQT
nr:protein kinase [Hymenolepis microstoma]